MKCCLEPQTQHFIRFLLCNVAPGDTLGQYCNDNNPCEVFLFLFLSVSYRILHGHFPVAQEAPHNIIQCCPWGSRQLCKRKKPVQCCLNIPGTTLQSWKPFTMLSKRLQTTLHKKNHVQCCLNTLGTTLHSWKPYAMLSERLQITLHKKKSCAMLSSYSWDNIPQLKTLCNVVRDPPDNIA